MVRMIRVSKWKLRSNKVSFREVIISGRLKFPAAPLTLDDALRPGARNAEMEASREERGEDRPVATCWTLALGFQSSFGLYPHPLSSLMIKVGIIGIN